MDTYCVGGQSHKMFGDSSFLWRTRREETWGRWCDEEESDHKHILNVSTQWSCTPSIWKHYGWIFSEQMLELLVSNYWFVCAVRLSLIQSVSISGCRQISVIQWAFREQGTNSLTSLAVWRNQSLADSALVMVSWVVNVWEKVKQQQSESSRCSQWTGVNTYVCVCVCARGHLGGDDEECGLCVELGEGLGHVSPVDVGDEPNVWSTSWVRLQSLRHHQRALNAPRQHSYSFHSWSCPVVSSHVLYSGLYFKTALNQFS